MEEVWKNIETGKEYDKNYQVSNTAKVRRLEMVIPCNRGMGTFVLPGKDLKVYLNDRNQRYFKIWTRGEKSRKRINIYLGPQLRKLFGQKREG